MRSSLLSSSYRPLLAVGAGAVLAVTATACGGGGSGSGSGSSGTSPPAAPSSSASAMPSAPASPEPTAGAAAQSAIRQDWLAFFNGGTPTSQRVSLLQNGQLARKVLQAQSKSSLASSSAARVTKVSLTSPTQASVTYDILVSGQPVLKNRTGTAVYKSGVWKVGDASFCGLLKMENSSKNSALSTVCKGA